MSVGPNVNTPMKRLFDPWRSPLALWQAITYLVLALPMGIITFTVVITLLATGAGLLITFLLALPVLWLLFTVSHGLAAVERSHVDALMGVHLDDPVPPLHGRVVASPAERTSKVEAALARDRPPPRVAADGCVRLRRHRRSAWCGALAMAGMPAYVGALPGDSAKFYFFEVHQGGQAVLAAAIGVAALVLIVAVDHRCACSDDGVDGEHAAGSRPGRRDGGTGHPARDQPQRCGRQRRGRTPAHRTRLCTTALSSAWSHWLPAWVPPRRSSRPTRKQAASWWPKPTRRPRRR